MPLKDLLGENSSQEEEIRASTRTRLQGLKIFDGSRARRTEIPAESIWDKVRDLNLPQRVFLGSVSMALVIACGQVVPNFIPKPTERATNGFSAIKFEIGCNNSDLTGARGVSIRLKDPEPIAAEPEILTVLYFSGPYRSPEGHQFIRRAPDGFHMGKQMSKNLSALTWDVDPLTTGQTLFRTAYSGQVMLYEGRIDPNGVVNQPPMAHQTILEKTCS